MNSPRYFAASLRDDLPTIDLHGTAAMQTAQEQLEKELFLFSSQGEEVCRVVHGIGSGAMKEMVHLVLKKNPLVEGFQLSGDGGSTIVIF